MRKTAVWAVNGTELKRKKTNGMQHCYPKALMKNRQHAKLIGTVRNDLNLMRVPAVVLTTTQKFRFSS